MRASPLARCLVVLSAVAILAGCNKGKDAAGGKGAGGQTTPADGPNPASPAVNDLKRLGLLYQSYCSENMKAPSGVEDFAPWVKMEPSTGPVVDAVRSGKYVLIWNVNLADRSTPRNPDEVLGYEASAPTSGGYVLREYGGVDRMSAAEFQAAPKATPEK
jgi:hypothetical protein